MRKRELLPVLRKWQRKLWLKDWVLDLEIRPKSKMVEVGCTEYDLEQRAATIVVRADVEDKEAIIVHELMHSWTRMIRASPESDLIEEQALEAICDALLSSRKETP